MRKIKKIILNQELIVELKEDYVKPYTKGECLVKAERVLLTPLDVLAAKGRIESIGYGTLAYGSVLEPQNSVINGRVYVNPRNPRLLPPVNQEGVGSSIFKARIECLRTPPSWIRHVELTYIYNVIQDSYFESTGRTLLVNAGGLQGILTAHLLRHSCYIYGLKSKKHGVEARVVSRDSLSRVAWDTVLISTINQSLVMEVLKEIHLSETYPKIIINPFTAAILELNIPLIVGGECKLIVPPKTGSLEKEVAGALEEVVRKKNLIYSVKSEETPTRMYKDYVTIIFS